MGAERHRSIKYWSLPAQLETLRGWAMSGRTNEDIAAGIGIANSTLTSWHKREPLIADALSEGKERPDMRVVTAAHLAGIDHVVKVRKPVKLRHVEYDPDTGRKLREWEEVVLVEQDELVKGDTTARIFWLTNRRPDEWWLRKAPDEAPADDDRPTGIALMPARQPVPTPDDCIDAEFTEETGKNGADNT